MGGGTEAGAENQTDTFRQYFQVHPSIPAHAVSRFYLTPAAGPDNQF